MALDKIPFNWFDLALLVVLFLGIWRGRKHGMSEETLPLAKWLVIVFGAAVAYEPVGQFLMGVTPFGLLFCYILGYLLAIGVVFALFSLFKRALGGKLIGSDMFGRSEYYLGMGAGMVRFACILMVGLAMLNSRLYTAAEVRAMQRFQQENFDNNFFPTLQSVQSSVFERSLTGTQIQKYCAQFLIKPTSPGGAPLQRPQRELPGV